MSVLRLHLAHGGEHLDGMHTKDHKDECFLTPCSQCIMLNLFSAGIGMMPTWILWPCAWRQPRGGRFR